MNTSERVGLIKRIAAHLAEEPWFEIDFVLRQFGFSTLDEWGDGSEDGRRAYAMEMLQDGTTDS